MSLRDLYQEIIIDHGKQPRNFGRLDDATHSHAGNNPLCGDQLTIYITTENDKISNILFEGAGCAISMASASLMSEAVKGKTTVEFLQLFTDFHNLVTGDKAAPVDLGKLSALSGVQEFPVRVKCATLAWHTLKAALANEKELTSTE